MKSFVPLVVALVVLLDFSDASTSVSLDPASPNPVSPDRGLVRGTWTDLKNNVKLKHYSPANRKAQLIYYSAPTGVVGCRSCNASLPFIVYSHGFMGHVDERWVSLYSDRNVILIDWTVLSSPGEYPPYDAAAHNSIDVGRYTGKMLAALCRKLNITGAQIRLIGHSLGGHLVGNAGRTFQQERPGDAISRVTALDPAGPRWVDGQIFDAIPLLHRNRLRHTDGGFVDVIHTNAALKPCMFVCQRMGDLHQLGHADFYVGKGRYVAAHQPACPNFYCSHMYAINYMMNSVKQPRKYSGSECVSIKMCKKMKVVPNGVTIYMGEAAVKPATRTLFYVDPTV